MSNLLVFRRGEPLSQPRSRSRSRSQPRDTYVSAWITKYGPSPYNYRIPHRLYGFKNSIGSNTVYISNQNIRSPLSGRIGQEPPPTNAEVKRLLRKLVKRVGHTRYIANMARNIVAARKAASNYMKTKRKRSPTPAQIQSNAMHNKQTKLWETVLRIMNAEQNNIRRENRNVPDNVKQYLMNHRRTIKNK